MNLLKLMLVFRDLRAAECRSLCKCACFQKKGLIPEESAEGRTTMVQLQA